MAGFIAITTGEWIDYLKENNISSAVFWCKKRSFKALKKGEEFFFLRRSSFKTNADRYIVGKGCFVEFEYLESREIWKKYKESVGFGVEFGFNKRIEQLYHKEAVEMGCIILNNVEFFERPLSLKECGIDFSPYIVSGKTMSDEECQKINSCKEKNNE